MNMKVDVTTIDPVRRRLSVEIPAEEVTTELERAYADLGRGARVPGFRPGRAPRAVLERMFGDRVRADVFAQLIQRSYATALDQERIDAVGRPEIVTEQAEPGVAFRYSATVEIKPDITVTHYAGLEVERPVVSVEEADVDRFLERLRQGYAQLHPVTDRDVVAPGDVATVEYEVRLDGRVVGRADERQVEIGANGLPPAFDAALSGVAVGATVDFPVTYPADHSVAELAGKTVQFHVRVRGLSHKEVPALDDEFAKDHGECDSLAALRQRVRTRLEAEAGRFADEAMRRNLLAALVRANEVPVPQALVDRRTDALVAEVWQEWAERRIVPKNESETVARLRTELAPRAREQVQVGLLLEAIARQEGIAVSDADVDQQVAAMVADAGEAADRVRALYQNEDLRAQLRGRMAQGRTIDMIAARAVVKDVAASSVADTSENG